MGTCGTCQSHKCRVHPCRHLKHWILTTINMHGFPRSFKKEKVMHNCRGDAFVMHYLEYFVNSVTIRSHCSDDYTVCLVFFWGGGAFWGWGSTLSTGCPIKCVLHHKTKVRKKNTEEENEWNATMTVWWKCCICYERMRVSTGGPRWLLKEFIPSGRVKTCLVFTIQKVWEARTESE